MARNGSTTKAPTTTRKRTAKSNDVAGPSEDWVVRCAKRMMHERQEPARIAAFIAAVAPHVTPAGARN